MMSIESSPETLLQKIEKLNLRMLVNEIVGAPLDFGWRSFSMVKSEVNSYYHSELIKNLKAYGKATGGMSLYVMGDGYYLIDEAYDNDTTLEYRYHYRPRTTTLATLLDMRESNASELNKVRPRFDYGYIFSIVTTDITDEHPVTMMLRGLIRAGAKAGIGKLMAPDLKTWNLTAQVLTNRVGELPKQQLIYDTPKLVKYDKEVKGFLLNLTSGYVLVEMMPGMTEGDPEVCTVTIFVKQNIAVAAIKIIEDAKAGELTDYVNLYNLLDTTELKSAYEGVLLSPRCNLERTFLKTMVEAV